MPLGPKMAPPRRSHVLHRLIYGKHEKIFLFEAINHKSLSLDIWYVASPSGPLPSLFKLCPWGQKRPCPGVTCLTLAYIGKNMKKSSCLKPQGLEPWCLVCSITLWTSTKFVQIMPLRRKMAPPRGHMFYIGLYWEKHENIFLTKSLDIWYV